MYREFWKDSEKASNFFRSQYVGEIWKRNNPGHFGFMFKENKTREITWLLWCHHPCPSSIYLPGDFQNESLTRLKRARGHSWEGEKWFEAVRTEKGGGDLRTTKAKKTGVNESSPAWSMKDILTRRISKWKSNTPETRAWTFVEGREMVQND